MKQLSGVSMGMRHLKRDRKSAGVKRSDYKGISLTRGEEDNGKCDEGFYECRCILEAAPKEASAIP